MISGNGLSVEYGNALLSRAWIKELEWTIAVTVQYCSFWYLLVLLILMIGK